MENFRDKVYNRGSMFVKMAYYEVHHTIEGRMKRNRKEKITICYMKGGYCDCAGQKLCDLYLSASGMRFSQVFFKNYTYFSLPCRELGLVGLALYLVD